MHCSYVEVAVVFYISQSKFLDGSFEVSLLLPNLLAIAFVVLSIFVEVDLHLLDR